VSLDLEQIRCRAQPLDAVPADGTGLGIAVSFDLLSELGPVAWAGAGGTGPPDEDRLARTNWWSPTFG
jgi:hypothetical protein